MLYTIKNDTDELTFDAPSDEVAALAASIFSDGTYVCFDKNNEQLKEQTLLSAFFAFNYKFISITEISKILKSMEVCSQCKS